MLLILLGLVRVSAVFVKSMLTAALYWKVTVLQNSYKQAVETSKAKQKFSRPFGRTQPIYVWKDQVCLSKLNKNITGITKFAGAQSLWQSCQAANHVLLSMLHLGFLRYKITTLDLQILQICWVHFMGLITQPHLILFIHIPFPNLLYLSTNFASLTKIVVWLLTGFNLFFSIRGGDVPIQVYIKLLIQLLRYNFMQITLH